MRNSKINYLMVGVFVIGMMAALIVSIGMLSGRTGATDAYFATYDNITGVQFGTQVLYEGYPIGQVESITPEPRDGRMLFRVDFTVQEGWKIPNDSLAEIAAPGLLSAITISISAGDSRDALEPGTEIRAQEAASIFAVMSSVAGDISDLAENSIKPLLLSLNQIVGQDGRVLLTDLRDVVGDIKARIPQIATDMEQFTGKLNMLGDEAATLVSPSNRARVEKSIGNIDTASKNLAQLSGQLIQTRAEAEKLLATMTDMVDGNRENINEAVSDLRYVVDTTARHIDAVNQNLEGTARNMHEFSRQIRKNPGLLLGGSAPAEKAKGN